MKPLIIIFVVPLMILISIVVAVVRPDSAEFSFVNGPELETLDPPIVTGSVEARIVGSLLEGLTTYNPRDLSAEPGVAERWEVSDNGLVYTFFLRESKWSNGQEVTAYDFVYSWKRALLPETAADYAYQLYYIKNAKLFNEGSLDDFEEVGIKAVDKYTFQVTLEHPTPFFINLTAFPTLLPVNRQCVETYGDKWTKPQNMVTNGPFCLAKWSLNQHLLLKKNELYWDASNVALKTIKSQTVESINTAFNMYESLSTDLIYTVPLPVVDILVNRSDFQPSVYLATYFFRFNVTKSPFDNVLVRKAFSYAY